MDYHTNHTLRKHMLAERSETKPWAEAGGLNVGS